jgi:hypothetical protein
MSYDPKEETWKEYREGIYVKKAGDQRSGEIRDALIELERCASGVSRLGAIAGPHWLRLNHALIKARSVLHNGPT